MKSQSEKIIFPAQNAFKVIKYSVPYFKMDFHHHPEFELVYITRGSGIRNIGASVHKYQAGDMVFLGPDLAHVWISPKEYQQKISKDQAEAIVVQFSQDLFTSLMDTPEFSGIKNLFLRAHLGVRVGARSATSISRILKKMLRSDGITRIQNLISILELLSLDDEQVLLNTSDYQPPRNRSDGRIHTVHQFVVSCYSQSISSRDAARVANMEHAAFCRLFKAKTHKTFTQFLNEVRIDRACQRLLAGDGSVTGIAYEVGYNNMGHFYKQFKKIMGMKPLEFKNK